MYKQVIVSSTTTFLTDAYVNILHKWTRLLWPKACARVENSVHLFTFYSRAVILFFYSQWTCDTSNLILQRVSVTLWGYKQIKCERSISSFYFVD